MDSVDDLMDLLAVNTKIFMFDNFLTHDELDEATTSSGSLTYSPREVRLDTNLISGSEARVAYSSSIFNPLYSRLLVRLRLTTMSDAFAFWGFRQNLTAPTWHMTESHAGFMLYEGTLYAVTGDDGTPSANYQAIPIKDIDCTRDLLFEIVGQKFRWWSIPFLETELGQLVQPGLQKVGFRKWSPVYNCGSVQPQDQTHYIYFFIKNSTNSNRQMAVKNICYREEYSD